VRKVHDPHLVQGRPLVVLEGLSSAPSFSSGLLVELAGLEVFPEPDEGLNPFSLTDFGLSDSTLSLALAGLEVFPVPDEGRERPHQVQGRHPDLLVLQASHKKKRV
jgi:hypothetical protein